MRDSAIGETIAEVATEQVHHLLRELRSGLREEVQVEFA